RVVEEGDASRAGLRSAAMSVSNRQVPTRQSISEPGARGSTRDSARMQSSETAGRKTAHRQTPLDTSGWSVWRYYLLALFAYLLALFSKTTACTLPAGLVLVAWVRGRRLSWRLAGQILPFVLFGLAMGLVSIWWEGNLGTYNQNMGLSFSVFERALIAG